MPLLKPRQAVGVMLPLAGLSPALLSSLASFCVYVPAHSEPLLLLTYPPFTVASFRACCQCCHLHSRNAHTRSTCYQAGPSLDTGDVEEAMAFALCDSTLTVGSRYVKCYLEHHGLSAMRRAQGACREEVTSELDFEG